MDFLSNVLEVLTDWARAIWPGVVGSAIGAYGGWSLIGFPGFLVGAALGAVGGTWAGHQLGLVVVKRITGAKRNDQLIYAGSAFLFIVCGYLLFQFAVILATILAIATIAAFWLSS